MKLNIDTTTVRGSHTKAINTKASEIIAELEDRLEGMTSAERTGLLDRLHAVLSDPGATTAFSSGTYAQNNAGQPAAALGAGSSTAASISTADALQVILADTSLDAGFKQLMRRAYDQSAPDHIEVEANGTPKELTATRNERDQAQQERDQARRDLSQLQQKFDNEHDPAKRGSLAQQLRDMTQERDNALAANMPADVKATRKAAKEAWKNMTPTTFGDSVKLPRNDANAIDALMADIADDGS